MLERLFHLKESGTNIKTESVAGITTFLTLSYIIFVQPAVLGAAGMDQGSVFVATCVSAALGCLLMGFPCKLPDSTCPRNGP